VTPTATANKSRKLAEGEFPRLALPARVLCACLSQTLARTVHQARSHLRKLPLLAILALLSSAVAGQSIAGRGDLEGFLKTVRPTSIRPTDVGLAVVDHELSPDGRTLTVTLRNNHWKDITAWSLSRSHGTSRGAGFIGSSGEDDFYEIAANPQAANPGIASGKSILHRIRFSEPIDLSPDRFNQGNFDVLVLSPGGVIFSDGTYAGEDVGFLRNAFADRLRYLDEAQALLHTLEDLGNDAAAWHRYLAELGTREDLTPPERTLSHTYERLRANLTRDAPGEAAFTVQSWLSGVVRRGLPHLPRDLRQSLTFRRSH